MKGYKAIRRNWKKRINDVFALATGAQIWYSNGDHRIITVATARVIFDVQKPGYQDDGAVMYENNETGEVVIRCYNRDGIERINITFQPGGFPDVQVSPAVAADCDRMIAELGE
jgi:hypothetical protein